MKDFQDDGNLFPGIHPYTVSNFEKQFVYGFPNSKTRKLIYENFKEWLQQLMVISQPYSLWIDGSYLTQKLNPNDIDLVVFYRPEDINSKEKAAELDSLIHIIGNQYDCDAYLCLELEHINPQIVSTKFRNQSIMKKYWMGQFCFDRQRRPKGMVEFDKKELIKSFGGEINGNATGTDK